jgi:hypothetical protein
VQIIEHEDERSIFAGTLDDSDHRRKEQVPLGVCVGRLRRRELAEALMQSRHQANELPSVRLDVGEQLSLVGMGDIVSEGLREG